MSLSLSGSRSLGGRRFGQRHKAKVGLASAQWAVGNGSVCGGRPVYRTLDHLLKLQATIASSPSIFYTSSSVCPRSNSCFGTTDSSSIFSLIRSVLDQTYQSIHIKPVEQWHNPMWAPTPTRSRSSSESPPCSTPPAQTTRANAQCRLVFLGEQSGMPDHSASPLVLD